VKAFLTANPYQRDLDAVWTLRDPATAYRSRDAGLGERPPAGWTALFPHQLRGAQGADGQFATQWQRSPFVNAYLGRMALALSDALELGRRGTTDFLGISFTGTDRVGHAFGPDSREYEDVAARLDDVLGDLITTLDAKVGRARYVLALTADHGVTSVPSIASGTCRVVNEEVRERIEETLSSRYGPGQGGTHVESSVWGGYVLRPATRTRLASDPSTVRAVQEAVGAIPGVARLIYTPTIALDARDPLIRMAALSGANTRRGEFLLAVAKDWTYSTRNAGDAVHHNTGQEYNQRVPLLFLGGGIRAGVYSGEVSPVDIAPTLAALAGISMPTAEGRVLRGVSAPGSTQPR
jgi:predicted AlkP superfamily pyrophosphatase or phosphodiesterase